MIGAALSATPARDQLCTSAFPHCTIKGGDMASHAPTDTNSPAYSGPGRIEFVILISAVMMITAFAIDSMLTALPAIGDSLHIAHENDRQYVISSFLGGFAAAQLFIGTITDRYGRRKLMLYALVGFAITSLGATLAQSFDQLLAARVLQGMMAATAQVVVRSVVRDRFSGREMAQVMSLASMIFMAAPILAPAMGQLVLNSARGAGYLPRSL
jgi:MFS transporter, DHA1 family, multidrug resistance protein